MTLTGAARFGQLALSASPFSERAKMEGSKRFFFEKKKQKTFDYGGMRRGRCQSPQDQKFFGSFFQKRTSFFLA
jgi:hypothetical protein